MNGLAGLGWEWMAIKVILFLNQINGFLSRIGEGLRVIDSSERISWLRLLSCVRVNHNIRVEIHLTVTILCTWVSRISPWGGHSTWPTFKNNILIHIYMDIMARHLTYACVSTCTEPAKCKNQLVFKIAKRFGSLYSKHWNKQKFGWHSKKCHGQGALKEREREEVAQK